MCTSPHEWSLAEIEKRIDGMQYWIDMWRAGGAPAHERDIAIFEGRIQGLEKMLKERADAGVI